MDELDLSAESEAFDSDKGPDFVPESDEDKDLYKPRRFFELRFQRQLDLEEEAGLSHSPWSAEPTIPQVEEETGIHHSPEHREERRKKFKRNRKI